MSTHRSDLIEGFLDLLDATGRQMSWGETGFIALVRDTNPENESYDYTPTDDDEVTVSALRSSFPELPRIGDSFEDQDGVRYRIKSMRRPPNHVIARFNCEVTHP